METGLKVEMEWCMKFTIEVIKKVVFLPLLLVYSVSSVSLVSHNPNVRDERVVKTNCDLES